MTYELDGITEADLLRLRERFNPATDDLQRMAEAFREIRRERIELERDQRAIAAQALNIWGQNDV